MENAVNNPLDMLLGIGTGTQSGPTGVSSPDGQAPIFGEMLEGLLAANGRIPVVSNVVDDAALDVIESQQLVSEDATGRLTAEQVVQGDAGAIQTDSNLFATLPNENLPAGQTSGTATPEASRPVAVNLSSTTTGPVVFPTVDSDSLIQQEIDRFAAGVIEQGGVDPVATTTGNMIIAREPVDLANGLYEVKQAQVQGNQIHLELAAPDADSPTIELRIDLESLKGLSTEPGRTQLGASSGDNRTGGLSQTSFGTAVAPARTSVPLGQLEAGMDLLPAKNPNDISSGFEYLLKKTRVTQIEISRSTAAQTNSKNQAGAETHLTIVAEQSGREMLIRAKLDPDSMTAIARQKVLPGASLSADQHQTDILTANEDQLGRAFVAQRSAQRTELSGAPLGDRNMVAASQYQVATPEGMAQVRRVQSDMGTSDKSWQPDNMIPGESSERVATELQPRSVRMTDSFRVAMTDNSSLPRSAADAVDGAAKTFVEQTTLGVQAIDDPLKTDIGVGRQKMASTSPVRVHLPENTQLKLNAGRQVITLRIEPEQLGPAKLTLSMHNNRLRASVIVNSVEAKAVLENSIESLTQQLSRADIKIDQIDVQLSNQQQQNQFGGRQTWQSWSSLRNPAAGPATDSLETTVPYVEPLQAMQQVGAGGVNILA